VLLLAAVLLAVFGPLTMRRSAARNAHRVNGIDTDHGSGWPWID
jgi:hypothetical protein